MERAVASLGCTSTELCGLCPKDTASVLLPIRWSEEHLPGPVILLNKRSGSVRQPGDLCCPGGRVKGLTDRMLGWLLRQPGAPLHRSLAWRLCRQEIRGRTRRLLSVFWAGCLRESWEEMGLLPWNVEFLGVLPLYRLRLFDRRILPMAGWVHRQSRFRPNWEVDRILTLRLEDLLIPGKYGRYRIRNHPGQGENVYPCYIHTDQQGQEILWGATYWIVESFLRMVLGFEPPEPELRPLVEGELAENYLTGTRESPGRR